MLTNNPQSPVGLPPQLSRRFYRARTKKYNHSLSPCILFIYISMLMKEARGYKIASSYFLLILHCQGKIFTNKYFGRNCTWYKKLQQTIRISYRIRKIQSIQIRSNMKLMATSIKSFCIFLKILQPGSNWLKSLLLFPSFQDDEPIHHQFPRYSRVHREWGA